MNGFAGTREAVSGNAASNTSSARMALLRTRLSGSRLASTSAATWVSEWLAKPHAWAASARSCAFAAVAQAGATYKVSKQTAAKWMQGYLNAWETRDADAVVKLFTPNGVYQSIPGVIP